MTITTFSGRGEELILGKCMVLTSWNFEPARQLGRLQPIKMEWYISSEMPKKIYCPA